MDIDDYFDGKLAIIGNFPYNISSQIMFRVLEYRDKVIEVCGMFQKGGCRKDMCCSRIKNLWNISVF